MPDPTDVRASTQPDPEPSGAHHRPSPPAHGAYPGVPTWAKGLGSIATIALTAAGAGYGGVSQAQADAAKERAEAAAERAVLFSQVERIQEDIRDNESKLDQILERVLEGR